MIIYVNYCLDTLTTILRQYSNFAWPISQINLLVWESIFDQHKIMKKVKEVFIKVVQIFRRFYIVIHFPSVQGSLKFKWKSYVPMLNVCIRCWHDKIIVRSWGTRWLFWRISSWIFMHFCFILAVTWSIV